MIRFRSAILAAVAAAPLALLAAGCGGGAPTSADSTTTTGALDSSLAFARCMRSHGLPGWPDPAADGTFDKAKLRRLGFTRAQVRTVEDGPCKSVLPTRRPRPPITPADRADYLEAAACMRSHGFPDFPDPTFRNDNVRANIPSSVNQDAPQFRSAATTCTKLIPAGLPYSSSGP